MQKLPAEFIDVLYVNCNFSQDQPDTSGAQPKGVRLFPGDDTPRHFEDCNLHNCELPPGSTSSGICNRSVVEHSALDDTQKVIIGGKEIGVKKNYVMRVHGAYDENNKLIYLKSPKVKKDTPPEIKE